MKKFLVITLVVVLALSLAGTALAARVSLTKGVDVMANEEGRIALYATVPAGKGEAGEWADKTRAFSTAELATVVDTWVIEFAEDASGRNLAAVAQYDGNWWLQPDNNVVTVSGTTVTVDVKSLRSQVDMSGMANVDKAKITLCDWDGDLTSSDFVSSYAVSSGGGAPSTGVVTFIALAGAALFVSGTGAVIAGRKLKNK